MCLAYAKTGPIYYLRHPALEYSWSNLLDLIFRTIALIWKIGFQEPNSCQHSTKILLLL